ncbi:MAG: hypothetical protein E4H23_04680 [Chrysiogenales bacterium]|nr:MAG: hypothetical protein E4H23_04680 [Chrysiogenales bacterium]
MKSKDAADTRKKEIEKTISLTSVMPIEFLQFLKTGVLNFGTLMSWFDRDFPGHYMRLIRDVSITVQAKFPLNKAIQATLSNNGISRVMMGAPFDLATKINRPPESVVLRAVGKTTAPLILGFENLRYTPFEGCGVDTTWRLEMPKDKNHFDYDTLSDVLFTIHYTALEDCGYRAKVLAAMGQNEEG